MVGTLHGQLMNFAVQKDTEYQLLHSDENFSKMPVDQIDVVSECQQLFSLTDNVFKMHRIRNNRFEHVLLLVKTKGNSLFAVNHKRSKISADKTVRVCIAIGKKIQFWDLNRDKLIPFQETISIDGIAKSIAWQRNEICFATENGYAIYHVIIFLFLVFDLFGIEFVYYALFRFQNHAYHEKRLTYHPD